MGSDAKSEMARLLREKREMEEKQKTEEEREALNQALGEGLIDKYSVGLKGGVVVHNPIGESILERVLERIENPMQNQGMIRPGWEMTDQGLYASGGVQTWETKIRQRSLPPPEKGRERAVGGAGSDGPSGSPSGGPQTPAISKSSSEVIQKVKSGILPPEHLKELPEWGKLISAEDVDKHHLDQLDPNMVDENSGQAGFSVWNENFYQVGKKGDRAASNTVTGVTTNSDCDLAHVGNVLDNIRKANRLYKRKLHEKILISEGIPGVQSMRQASPMIQHVPTPILPVENGTLKPAFSSDDEPPLFADNFTIKNFVKDKYFEYNLDTSASDGEIKGYLDNENAS